MKTKLFLVLLAIAGILILPSCKEDDPSPLSADDAELAINTADAEFNTVKGEFMSSIGMQVQETIGELGLPFGTPGKSMPIIGTKKELLSAASKGGFAPDYIYISFNSYVGTWEKVEGTWTKTLTTPTDKIVVKFSFNGGTNNATLTYSDYVTKTSPYIKGESTYISQLKAKIDIDGQANPVMTWVYTANQTTTGGVVKTISTYGVYSVTDEYSAYTSTSGTITVEYKFEAKKNGNVVFSKYYKSVLQGFSNKSIETYSVDVTAEVTIMDLVIKYKIFINQDTDTSHEGNFITASLWLSNGAKVADVVFVGEEDEPYFEYSDGTRVSVESLLSEDLLYELEEFMEGLMWFF